jgi:tetratricopeptide (TPR) repeat protein
VAATPAAKAGKRPAAPPWDREQTGSPLDHTRALLIGILVACATLPYLNILVNGFVYDDDTQVMHNPYIRSFRYLKEIFTTPVWSFAGVHVSNYYRPMMTLGYLVCYKLFGMRAYGFHLASLLLHVLVVCLVFVITERLTGEQVCAFVAGALFALHPVHVESVAWIAAVTDVELTFFYLLTFGFFLALARPATGRGSKLIPVAMEISFLFALLSKEQAMTLPVLATVYEHFYRKDRLKTGIFRKLARYGPLWLVGTSYLLLRIRFLGALVPQERRQQLTFQQTVLSAVALVGQYTGKFLWPIRLCAFYIFRASKSLLDPRVLAGLLVLLGFAALFLICWRSQERNVRFGSFAILWFFATLAPVLNAHWVAQNVFSERYLYLPSVGLGWLAGLGAWKAWSRAAAQPVQRRALVLAGVVVGGLFAVRVVIRNRDWKDDIVLYTRTLELSPDSTVMLNNLAGAYWDQGEWHKAETLWGSVLSRDPDNIEALNDMGLVAGQRKQYPEAVGFFQRVIALMPNLSDPHRNLGVAYRLMGMPGPAERELRKAVELRPLDYLPLNDLGRLFLAEGRMSEAEDQFRASLRDEPNALAYDFLGEISIRRGAAKEAEGDFRAALGLDPADSNAHFGLGYLYQAAGRKAEALGQYEAGLAKDPSNAEALAAVQELRR